MIVTCPVCSTHYRHPAPGPGGPGWGRCANCATRFRLAGGRVYRLLVSAVRQGALRVEAPAELPPLVERVAFKEDVAGVAAPTLAPPACAEIASTPAPARTPAVPVAARPAGRASRPREPRSLGALLLPALLAACGATSGYALAVVFGQAAEGLLWSAAGSAVGALVGWVAARRARSDRAFPARVAAR